MRKSFVTLLLVFASLTFATTIARAQDNPMVGGAAMLRTRDIIDNAVNSADHTTLVAAVKAAGLVETLKGKGPFTVFAPTNAAFDKLPAGTVESLLKPENKGMLSKYDGKKLMGLIKKGGGSASLRTVSGGTLTAMMSGDGIILRDEKGNTSNVSISNVYQSNGVIHVVDTVLMPN
jgi:uncharacterized surface protein with fasciclin (FAS1) repeats